MQIGTQKVIVPLISTNLKAPLIAELDITSINRQLKTYKIDDIDSFILRTSRHIENRASLLKDVNVKRELVKTKT